MENPTSSLTANNQTRPTITDISKVGADFSEAITKLNLALNYVATLSTKQFMELRGMKAGESLWAK